LTGNFDQFYLPCVCKIKGGLSYCCNLSILALIESGVKHFLQIRNFDSSGTSNFCLQNKQSTCIIYPVSYGCNTPSSNHLPYRKRKLSVNGDTLGLMEGEILELADGLGLADGLKLELADKLGLIEGE
jgi:hypothetical protein